MHNVDETPTPMKAKQGFPLGTVLIVLVLAACAGFLVYRGIVARAATEVALRDETRDAAIQMVAVTHPKPLAPSQELVLPGNMQAFTDSPIYARTNGYLKRWYADIGARVKTGQLLAEIDAPEVDAQLQQARADLETSQANLKLAESTAKRWEFLLTTESVSKQETDEKIGDLQAKKAMVDSAMSNVHRLQDLQSYEKVYAPFDGVITARNTDVGALIDSGANTPARELFHLAATGRLRLYVSVPEQYQRSARNGMKAGLTLTEFPGRTFTGTLVRNAGSIDQASRTLNVEVDVNNSTGELLPGSYVLVHLTLPEKVSSTVTVPANALLFRAEGLRAGVVREGRAQLIPLKLGRDYGNSVEVLTGLQESDQVILNPADSLISGTPVRITHGEPEVSK